uniref:Uncharacterized protein n=1 Tax=Anguilla anguilla TaxID=7936 RepID=A0A0E9SWZ8_ANGAN
MRNLSAILSRSLYIRLNACMDSNSQFNISRIRS